MVHQSCISQIVHCVLVATLTAGSTVACAENDPRLAEDLLEKLRSQGEARLKFDELVAAQDVGLKVSFSLGEPAFLLGMPPLLKITIENQGRKVRQVVRLDGGANGFWLPDTSSESDFVLLAVHHLDSGAVFTPTLGSDSKHPRLMEFSHCSNVYGLRMTLPPLQSVTGDFDLSGLEHNEDFVWMQRLGIHRLFLIWIDESEGSSKAVVAHTVFEVQEPQGNEAQVWQAIVQADHRGPLSLLTARWKPELDAIAQTYPWSAYVKYISLLKARTLENNRDTGVGKGTFAEAAAAYRECFDRSPQSFLADEALLGHARCLKRRAIAEERHNAGELLRMAIDSLAALFASYPNTNCGPAARSMQSEIEDWLARLGNQK